MSLIGIVIAGYLLSNAISVIVEERLLHISLRIVYRWYWYKLWAFLLLPGTIIHEVSHWLAANLLLMGTKGIRVWPPMLTDRGLVLGMVRLNPENIDPVRHALSGMAPIFGGSFVVVLLGEALGLYQLAIEVMAQQNTAVADWLSNISQSPLDWLWLYLLFSVGNGMFPSDPVDKIYWTTLLGYIGLAVLLGLILGLIPSPVSPIVPLFFLLMYGAIRAIYRAFPPSIGQILLAFGVVTTTSMAFMLIPPTTFVSLKIGLSYIGVMVAMAFAMLLFVNLLLVGPLLLIEGVLRLYRGH